MNSLAGPISSISKPHCQSNCFLPLSLLKPWFWSTPSLTYSCPSPAPWALFIVVHPPHNDQRNFLQLKPQSFLSLLKNSNRFSLQSKYKSKNPTRPYIFWALCSLGLIFPHSPTYSLSLGAHHFQTCWCAPLSLGTRSFSYLECSFPISSHSFLLIAQASTLMSLTQRDNLYSLFCIHRTSLYIEYLIDVLLAIWGLSGKMSSHC